MGNAASTPPAPPSQGGETLFNAHADPAPPSQGGEKLFNAHADPAPPSQGGEKLFNVHPDSKADNARRVLDLNGTWQVEQGELQAVPLAFTHTVTVPGLIDMARPSFTEVGKPTTQR